MVIKPFKVKPELPESFASSTLDSLSSSINAVYAGQQSSLSQEELYRAVESLCLHKKAEELYTQLYSQCEQHTKTALQTLSSSAFNLDTIPFLTAIMDTWEQHATRLLTLRSIFLYLDRTYIIQRTDVHSLWEMGLILFSKHFRQDPNITITSITTHTDAEETGSDLADRLERKTRQGILSLIDQERQGQSIPRSLVRTLLRMYSALHLYSTLFEPAFFNYAREFYQQESSALLASFSLSDYLQHTQSRIHQESERLTSYLDPSSTQSLLSILDICLISHHCDQMISKGFDDLMRAKRDKDLATMYRLFARVDATEQLKQAFAAYVKQAGTDIVMPESKEQTMVEELIALKNDLDVLLSKAFCSNDSFIYSLKLSFESVLNLRENKPAECIARYLDKLLRSGGAKGMSEEELDVLLEKVMFLFRYIYGKDVFAAFYKKDLAKRLLLHRSASIDAEKNMINKLKAECGAAFTNKLEGMFKDMELSKDIQQEFGKHLKQLPNIPDLELSVQVLTTGSWPAYPPIDFSLPPSVSVLQDEFKTFYLHAHNGRKLVWQNSLATAIVRAALPKGKKELQVNGMQAIVLMCFNTTQVLQQLRTPQHTDDTMETGNNTAAASTNTSPASSSAQTPAPTNSLSFTALADLTKMPTAELKRVNTTITHKRVEASQRTLRPTCLSYLALSVVMPVLFRLFTLCVCLIVFVYC